MIKNILVTVLLCSVYFLQAQQNSEFESAKKYFDYQRFMLNNEFKKKFVQEPELPKKIAIKKDFSEFMIKLDSVQNTAFINTLIKVKNREDLSKINNSQFPKFTAANPDKSALNTEAQYPGGFNTLREQVADLFYTEAILPGQKIIRTDVVFVVEGDGSITSVHAEGDHFAFNRQAEIAMYLLPEKFTPARINGIPVRYRFRLPLSINFD